MLPSVLSMLVFVGYPLLQVMQFSTLDWGGTDEGTNIGLKNYLSLFTDADFGGSLFTTLIFALITLPLFMGLSILVAVEIDGTKLERLVKALMFMPGLVTVAASAISWYVLFSPDYGVISELTQGALSLPWGDQGWAALVLIALFTVWQNLGYGILVFSAGLKSIPHEVVEAARVDGAKESEIKRYIIVPLLRPSVVFLGVVGSLYALQSYTAVFLLTRGGPFGSTRVIGYYLYETAFERYRLGYAAAISVLVLIITFAFAAWQARRLKGSS
ncbi:sugar ABC transporter permease [Deinococcus cellulosilyticus NBRC 106333 = KACC 11606]|uniref:Sugar ABC transporter permease n=1 Tax=Deinococcus cellulosilyticus (strain DSM 18568 / NBRC 106333 / KACC 11606 / 5516J-15) TaxID=1223518 RepID=A0A511NB99_DEIC1|nr:sugar ABC transporter permease [Deinococcus cellulosilyticus NBRC 106333 = KACC 11606]